MPVTRYCKKPVEIEAQQLTGVNWREVYEWLKDNDAQPEIYTNGAGTGPNGLGIPTLEGVMRANEGDWIVRGVEGEFYPVKPAIFTKTYEVADAAELVLSDYDMAELVMFDAKVESEGFEYAHDQYGPEFESNDLDSWAGTYERLLDLWESREDAIKEWWQQPDARAKYDAHLEESRRRAAAKGAAEREIAS